MTYAPFKEEAPYRENIQRYLPFENQTTGLRLMVYLDRDEILIMRYFRPENKKRIEITCDCNTRILEWSNDTLYIIEDLSTTEIAMTKTEFFNYVIGHDLELDQAIFSTQFRSRTLFINQNRVKGIFSFDVKKDAFITFDHLNQDIH